jgi:hypothetical protein
MTPSFQRSLYSFIFIFFARRLPLPSCLSYYLSPLVTFYGGDMWPSYSYCFKENFAPDFLEVSTRIGPK